ncbi:MAG: nucleotide exchange factor GrpE [Lentisphaeria bacterium]|nr:nucleotide exchange factor GrpE [Lentisphaeria bacterium]
MSAANKDKNARSEEKKNTEHRKDEAKEKSSGNAAETKAAEAKAEPKAEEKKEEKTPKEEKLSPEERITRLEKTVVELEEKRIRLIAEMENQRKRAAKDLETMRYSVVADTLYPFFQVFDHFQMAVDACAKSDNIQALNAGMQMIGTEFAKAFENLGIVKIDAVGKDFDASCHEAVAQEASYTVPECKVIRQLCAGYKMNDHLLKAASVVVSSGPAKKEEDAEKEEESAAEDKKD